jgi:hypothetical protein
VRREGFRQCAETHATFAGGTESESESAQSTIYNLGTSAGV